MVDTAQQGNRRSAPGAPGCRRDHARCALVMLIMGLALVQLAGCVRVSVRARADGQGPALRGAGGATPVVSPALAPRQALYLSTRTPIPRPSPSPTPTIPPPTPIIPRAQTPPSELTIPSIRLQAPIVAVGWREEGTAGEPVWDDPGPAVGWLQSSALPGEGSNVVLSGHHNRHGEVFRHLVDVSPGDEVFLVAGGVSYRYLVRERFIIPEKHASIEQREQNALWIAPTIDERLTLLTCWPYRDNTHRLIVVAAPAPIISAD